MDEPNWVITSLIGAVVGYLLPYIIKFINYIIRKLHKDLPEGNWHVYHKVFKGASVEWIKAEWKIRKAITSKYKIREYRNKTLLYTGELFQERNFWTIRLKAKKHEEEGLFRLKSPITTNDSITWGIYLAISLEGNGISGPILVTREKLELFEVEEILNNNVKHLSEINSLEMR